MTVDELIKELIILKSKGNGGATVMLRVPVDDQENNSDGWHTYTMPATGAGAADNNGSEVEIF